MNVNRAELQAIALLHDLGTTLSRHPETDFSVQLARDVRARKKAWWSAVKRTYRLEGNGKYKIELHGINAGEIRHKRTGQPVGASREAWTTYNKSDRSSRVFDTERQARDYAGQFRSGVVTVSRAE